MQRLRYLAHLYFHQDWDIEAPTPVGAMENYRREEPQENVDELRSELSAILAADPSEEALDEIWDQSGADWDPRLADWGTYREWFEAMLKAVS